MVVSHLMWVLRTEPGSSGRVASVFNYSAIFPAIPSPTLFLMPQTQSSSDISVGCWWLCSSSTKGIRVSALWVRCRGTWAPWGSASRGHGHTRSHGGGGYWDELAPEITSLLASSLPMLCSPCSWTQFSWGHLPIKLLAPKCSSYICIFKLTFKTR